MRNKEEFCENIRLYEKAMYYVAFSIMKNETDAGDAVSEAIYRAYKNLDTLKSNEAFKSWILRIVHNTALEMIRKNSRLVFTEDTEELSEHSYESGLTTKITVRKAVEGLKQPYRTIVILFYYDDLSVAEISEITGSSQGAVKKQLSRARNMLLQELKEDFAV